MNTGRRARRTAKKMIVQLCWRALVAAITLAGAAAAAQTYEVGPGKPFVNLQAVAPLLAPGDTVLVYGNTTYTGGIVLSKAGAANSKITIRGVRVNGLRPVLSGGTNTIEFRANHYIFEGFEVTGGSFRGIYHHADDITIRDSLVRDCPAHGILGADADSGSLLLEYTEVRNCGNGTTQHQVYMATDNTKYPNAVFRMQYCYIHHANGGNNIKSRAGRSEIYYNWIEGAQYHQLELIGADGQPPALVREDSDVVGNILLTYSTQGTYTTRIGGDGTGTSAGRHRFVNNTIILPSNGNFAVFRLFDTLESFESHNNIIYKLGGGAAKIMDTSGLAIPYASIAVSGSNNWIPTASASAPAQWTGTISGTNPGFVNSAANDFRLQSSSPLVHAGNASPQSPPGFPFPNPLILPFFEPPVLLAPAPGWAHARAVNGNIDIGAFELPPAPLQGSGEDLQLSVLMNNLGDPAEKLKVAFASDITNIHFQSAGGTFTGAYPLLAVQYFPTGYSPVPPPEFPYLHMDLAGIESLYDPFSAPPPDTGILPAAGVFLNFTIPPGFAGITARLQALAASPAAVNGIFAVSDPVDVRLE